MRLCGARRPHVGTLLRELRNAGLTTQHTRAGVERLREQTGDDYVLASEIIVSDGGELLYGAASEVAPEWVRARDGRVAIRQVVEAVIGDGSYAVDGYAFRLHLRSYGSADVIIDPRFGFGQPVLGAGKLRVETVADLFFGGGESVADIADEYDLSTDDVEAVLRVMARRVA